MACPGGWVRSNRAPGRLQRVLQILDKCERPALPDPVRRAVCVGTRGQPIPPHRRRWRSVPESCCRKRGWGRNRVLRMGWPIRRLRRLCCCAFRAAPPRADRPLLFRLTPTVCEPRQPHLFRAERHPAHLRNRTRSYFLFPLSCSLQDPGWARILNLRRRTTMGGTAARSTGIQRAPCGSSPASPLSPTARFSLHISVFRQSGVPKRYATTQDSPPLGRSQLPVKRLTA
jgi:hypothetical protein